VPPAVPTTTQNNVSDCGVYWGSVRHDFHHNSERPLTTKNFKTPPSDYPTTQTVLKNAYQLTAAVMINGVKTD